MDQGNQTNNTPVMLHHFDWTEYAVFSATLGLSALIGVYFGCVKGGQNTLTGYLLGGKQMTVFPIAMSLVSSYISGVTLLGVPAETYRYGTQYLMVNIANFAVCFITVFVFLPVFYKLQLVSLYEYFELRFNSKIRLLTSILYTFSMISYIPFVIYGPALALNQVSGLSVHVVSPVISVVCIFYTTLGGLKAVVWSDTLQGGIMLGAVVTVVVLATHAVGGLSHVLSLAEKGDRLEFFNMNPDPTIRHSFWTSTVGLTVSVTAHFAASPSTVQRFISLPTLSQARISVFCLCIGICLFTTLSVFTGVVMYARYHNCDPLSTKVVERPDQMVPYFIMDVAGNVTGLPGIFLAGIVCAALSTMSTGLNTMAGTIYEDFVEPQLSSKLSEGTASFIIKIIVVVAGAICVILVAMIEKLGAILEVSSSFSGLTTGATLGIFILGILFPIANSKGAIAGSVVGLIVMSFILAGSRYGQVNGSFSAPTKPFSVKGCAGNFTLPKAVSQSVMSMTGLSYVFKVSFFYYSLMGSTIVIVVGLIVSAFTGGGENDLNPDLFSPLVHHWVRRSSRGYMDVSIEEITVQPSISAKPVL